MRALVTGASGLIGRHLVAALVADGVETVALSRTVPAEPPGAGLATWRQVDVTDAEALSEAVRGAAPEVVYHLAAQSFPRVSWERPVETMEVNLLGTLHLLDALRRHAPGCRVVAAGSSAEYAPSSAGAPVAEEDARSPLSLYGVSKLAQDELVRLYGAYHELAAIRVRPFFLIGPGKEGDVCSDFASRIAAIERGEETTLRVGNLEAVRDFLDVRDGVRAFRRVAERGEPGEVYNICSGKGTSLERVLELFTEMAACPINVEKDPHLMRPLDEPVKVGNPEKLKALGWEVEVPLEATLRGMLEYWREAKA